MQSNLIFTIYLLILECKCGNGRCNDQGICECNAGFILKENKCTECNQGYYKSGSDCKSCPPACGECDGTGKCISCLSPDLQISSDDGKCIPKPAPITCAAKEFYNAATGLCETCDAACETCFGQGSGKCLQCVQPTFYLEGTCAQAPNGKCISNINTNTNQSFFVDNQQKICEACPSSCIDCNIPNFTESSTVQNMICTECMPGFSLDKDNGKCVENCGEGRYTNENFECQGMNLMTLLYNFFLIKKKYLYVYFYYSL
jgi:hypothetical protein